MDLERFHKLVLTSVGEVAESVLVQKDLPMDQARTSPLSKSWGGLTH